MKTPILISTLFATMFFIACGNKKEAPEGAAENKDTTNQVKGPGPGSPTSANPLDGVVRLYLDLKNALASDNGEQAATAAKQMGEALEKVDPSGFTAEQKKTFGDIRDDVKEHTEHIGANGTDIAHQREHFDLLSKDMIDLVRVTGSTQTLYRDFCPMYNDKKGAYWLSETKEIKNPYYGAEMPKCGEVKEEIKPQG